MTDILSPDTRTGQPAAGDMAAPTPVPQGPEAPSHIPAKFWDAGKGEVRTDMLLQSYQELERKLGGMPRPDVPEAPDGYEIKVSAPYLEIDKEVNAMLHQAGFSRQQAQVVYDLAAERLAPVVGRIAAAYETQRQVDRLSDHFGGAERWGELSQQISSWGQANLSADVFQALASSYDGVLALHRMMADSRTEPGLGKVEGNAGEVLGEAKLREMMKDPRYWKHQDPAYIAKVTRGYELLYPSEG